MICSIAEGRVFAKENLHEELPEATLLALYRTMVRIRRSEEAAAALAESREIRCPVHLYLGQEAVAAGINANLKPDDYVFGNHRSHGHYLAKGGGLKPMFAEFLGKATGCAGGRGGSMHLIDTERGILGTTPIVAASIPHAVGTALAAKIRGQDSVSVSFFGDGAVEEGTFHESVNFAAVQNLPVVFVCENNFYSSHLGLLKRRRCDNIYEYAAGHGIPGVAIDGNDVEQVYRAGRAAIARARSGGGPALLECRTYRWRGHVGPAWEFNLGIRDVNEVQEWMKRCPIKKLGERLLALGIASQEELDRVQSEEDAAIAEAVDFARVSEFPPLETMSAHVYA
ncbi:MAG TPA: thiamine pyrophosphate-dependent dehydrogenase E1 component subunit alpha [Bryobacteraceae bacterium]